MDKKFEYTYSAPQNAEIERIRKKNMSLRQLPNQSLSRSKGWITALKPKE